MTSARRTPVFARPLILLCALALLPVGCTREPKGTEGPLAVPPEGRLRVLSRKIEQTPDKLHWKWSLIGERNWSEASADATALRLAKTSALNSTSKTSGCNIWEVDVTVARGKDSPGKLTWTTRLHGIDGTTKEARRETPGDGPVPDAVQVVQATDVVTALPAELPLLRAPGDAAPVTLKVAK